MARDMTLQLRRRKDGSLHLTSDKWPPRHEFSLDWLLKNGAHVKVTDDEIVLDLANASATYKILDEDPENPTTGMWGKLVKGEVNGG